MGTFFVVCDDCGEAAGIDFDSPKLPKGWVVELIGSGYWKEPRIEHRCPECEKTYLPE